MFCDPVLIGNVRWWLSIGESAIPNHTIVKNDFVRAKIACFEGKSNIYVMYALNDLDFCAVKKS